MEEKGLIYRKPDAIDKRMVRIYLTPFGLEKREVSKNTVLELNQKIQSGISAQKLAIFFEVLESINQQLDTSDFFKSNTA